MNLILIIASISAIICQTFGRNHADQSKINSGALNDVCEAKSSWTIVANTENCHQFWICVNGKAEKFDCAANFYFDREEKRCKIGECPMEQSTTKCKSHNVRHIEGNCEAFLLCKNEEFVVQNCTKGQYFSKKYSSCQPVTINADHKCSCLLPPYATIDNSDDCESYYMCLDGKAKLRRCPRGQYYNKQVSSCLPDLTGICLQAPTISLNKSGLVEKCDQFTNNVTGLISIKNYCDKFFLCLNGKVSLKICPKGSFYDTKAHFCRWDASGICTKTSEKTLKKHFILGTESKLGIPINTEQVSKKNNMLLKKEKKHIAGFRVTDDNASLVPQREVSSSTNIKQAPFSQAAIKFSENINMKKEDFNENKQIFALNTSPSVHTKLSSKFIQL